MQILLVEDNPYERESLKSLIDFSEMGFERCIEACDGEEALRQINSNKPDIVVMDICMPKLGGLETMRRMTSLKEPPCVIVISGHSEFHYAQQAIKLGAVDYLLKPYPAQELKSAIERAKGEIKSRRSTKEIGEKANDKLGLCVPNNLIVKKAIEFINTNYQKDIRLKDVADCVYVTPSYLSSLFKQETGLNMKQYLNKVRVQCACDLLQDPGVKVYEIAMLVGFQDDKYFFSVFKKFMRTTPLNYRNQSAIE